MKIIKPIAWLTYAIVLYGTIQLFLNFEQYSPYPYIINCPDKCTFDGYVLNRTKIKNVYESIDFVVMQNNQAVDASYTMDLSLQVSGSIGDCVVLYRQCDVDPSHTCQGNVYYLKQQTTYSHIAISITLLTIVINLSILFGAIVFTIAPTGTVLSSKSLLGNTPPDNPPPR